MTDRELALRAEIMRSFAETGEPPEVPASEEAGRDGAGRDARSARARLG